MKRIFCLTVCLIFILFAGCNKKTELPKTYETKQTGKLSDSLDFKITDEKSRVWLDDSLIENITLEYDYGGQKTITFVTTEEGKLLLNNATNENIGKTLSLIIDNKMLFSPTVMAAIEDGSFTFSGNYLIDYTYLYNYLTGAKDKMAGVTPPNDLIPEDRAKQIVFERAKVTSNDVTKLEINLEIDQDYFGWKYKINFKANGVRYKTEVNAHNGSVLKFVF